MRANNRKDLLQVLIATFEESAASLEQSFDCFKEFAVGHFPTKVAPEHLNRIQPRTKGGQIQQHQPAGRATDHGFDFVVLMGIGIIPSDKEGAGRMFIHQMTEEQAIG